MPSSPPAEDARRDDTSKSPFADRKRPASPPELDPGPRRARTDSIRPRTPSEALTRTPGYSQANVDGKTYEVGPNTPASVQAFLGNTLSNNRYDSPQHLEQRAENFLRHIEAEKNILQQTTEGLLEPGTGVFDQTSWMGHLERGLWHGETRFGANDRSHLGDEALGAAEPKPGSPFHGQSGLKLSEGARSAFSMMLKGTEGPFTQEQARAGFEMAQTGQVLAGRLKLQERIDYRKDNRVDANRSGTHSTKTADGMDLTKDLGTRLRDEHGLPVMSGTSGSSSDAALATKFAAKQAGLTWAAPGLDDAQAQQAITDLSHHYFRAHESSPPHSMASGINAVRSAANLETKSVDTVGIFTHSYPEIQAGVSLTLEGASAENEEALRRATRTSLQRLKEAAPEGEKS